MLGPVPLRISLHCRIRWSSDSECQRGLDRREPQVKRFSEEEGKARPTISDMEPYAGLDMAKKRLGLQISHPSLNRSINIQKYYGNVVVSSNLSPFIFSLETVRQKYNLAAKQWSDNTLGSRWRFNYATKDETRYFWWKRTKSTWWGEACLRNMLQWHRWQFWCNSCENPFLLTKNIYLSKWNMRTQKMDSDSRCMCTLCHNISDMVWHQVKFISFSGNFRGLVQVQQTILCNRSCSLRFGISPPSAICSI